MKKLHKEKLKWEAMQSERKENERIDQWTAQPPWFHQFLVRTSSASWAGVERDVLVSSNRVILSDLIQQPQWYTYSSNRAVCSWMSTGPWRQWGQCGWTSFLLWNYGLLEYAAIPLPPELQQGDQQRPWESVSEDVPHVEVSCWGCLGFYSIRRGGEWRSCVGQGGKAPLRESKEGLAT